MAYDDVLLHLGEFGPYQRRIYFLLCLPAIVCAFHKLGGVFLLAKVDHRCLLPFEEKNASYNDMTEDIKKMSYPWESLADNFSSCEYFRADFSEEYFSSNVPAGETVRCNEWVFNTEYYHNTVLMEWNLVCDKAWLKSTSDSFFMTGVLLGSIIFGDLSDRYGRRPIFFVSLVVQVVAGVLAGIAPDYYTFTLCRSIVGATTSGVFLVAYVIAMEMVGLKKRTFAGIVVQMFFTSGYILTAGFAYYFRDWRYLQIALTLPGLLFFSYFWFIPESARWLLTKGRQQEAKEIIQKAAKENKVNIPNDTLDNLLAPTDEEMKKKEEEAEKKPSILDIFKHPNLRNKSLIIFFLWFVNSGTYYGLSWHSSSLGGGNAHVNFVLSGIVEYPGYLFVLFTLNRWGRKVLQCGCMLVAGTVLLLTMFVPKGMTWLTIALTMAGKMAITASYGTVYIFSTEQFPTVIRNVGLGASSTIARFGGILAPQINILAEIWKPLPLIIFGSLALFGGMVALILPETLNKKLPDSIEEGERFGKKSSMKGAENGELETSH